MPAVSNKQRKFMEIVAHDPKFAKKAGVPQKVGKDFSAADQMAKAQMLRKRGQKVADTDMDNE